MTTLQEVTCGTKTAIHDQWETKRHFVIAAVVVFVNCKNRILVVATNSDAPQKHSKSNLIEHEVQAGPFVVRNHVEPFEVICSFVFQLCNQPYSQRLYDNDLLFRSGTYSDTYIAIVNNEMIVS